MTHQKIAAELVELNHHDARLIARYAGGIHGMIDTESDPGSWADAIAHSPYRSFAQRFQSEIVT
jgi:hypothetical protein